jgi:hypothetical protein
MKVVLNFALIALTATLQTQPSTQAGSDLEVLKFSWTKYVTGSGLIRPVEADPAPGPVVINRAPTRDPNYQRPAANPTERHAEMAALERDAALSTNRSSNVYVIRIQVKNAGTKPIKSFVWASEDPDGVPDLATRQFLCSVKTKPNDTKTLEILSSLAPSRVVDASKAGDKTQQSHVLSPVINRIEYGDGSIWQRPGWDSSILSQDARPKSDGGKCVRL